MSAPQDAPGGRSRTIDADGPLHLVDYSGSGPPLVLVHGLGGSHLNWMLVALPLSRSFRVIAVDLPGFGLTPPEGRSTDVRRQARLLEGLIEREIGEPA
ncbi:MAG: alpha/beta fold hydrolase, partial [Actinobacteria bacterium]|nr:alpha/beta fold hydrolase [Actinomycetota bacterium]NIS30413.1 alpha/beta fold hydrolase [Actinomycetota bacterium]NIT95032.1 alpha/beta fold hydrolase [Actinomycetota bacterium]NIU65641.1 alpha/beta fold hydrolase [Actinomycetota bacterium]NIV55195.1 alpha/beta fold hydrolase [Actinomycetota bacterium]